MIARNMLINGGVLGLFALIGTGLLAYTFDNTKTKIAGNEKAQLLKQLSELIPVSRYNNDLYNDRLQITAPTYLGTVEPVTVYRARRNNVPVAAAFQAVAPNGYSGNIYLLMAINYEGTLAGVRVISHKETPGLGDPIELAKSTWIKSFDNKSLLDPPAAAWRVKKDGGVFDQFTGATITPRAVVQAVHKGLEYFSIHKAALFAPSAGALQQ